MEAETTIQSQVEFTLRWRHNERENVWNHQPCDCLLNGLFRRRSKKTLKLRVTGICAGNSPGTVEFPTQMTSNAENVSIWWRHYEDSCKQWQGTNRHLGVNLISTGDIVKLFSLIFECISTAAKLTFSPQNWRQNHKGKRRLQQWPSNVTGFNELQRVRTNLNEYPKHLPAHVRKSLWFAVAPRQFRTFQNIRHPNPPPPPKKKKKKKNKTNTNSGDLCDEQRFFLPNQNEPWGFLPWIRVRYSSEFAEKIVTACPML